MPNAAPIHRPPQIGTGRSYLHEQRPSAYRRGYGGKRWESLRRQTFLRDKYACQICGLICIQGHRDPRSWPHCDHIIPKSQGGSDALENLQTLCGSCHDSKTDKERREGGSK